MQISSVAAIRNAALAVALSVLTTSMLAEPVRFGSLSLEWPDGYSVKSTQVPFELAGPTGEKVLVTIMRFGKEASEPVDLEKMSALNTKFLLGQAQKAGRIVVALSKEVLPDGSTLQFVGSETSRLFKTGYFLQYLVLSPTGRLGFLTFEGIGDAGKEHEAVKPVFQSVQWTP